MQKLLKYTIAAVFVFTNYSNAQEIKEAKKTDSTFMYKNGEGTFIHVGKKNKSVIHISGALQSGIAFNKADDGKDTENSSRMSINLARIYLNGSFLNDKARIGLVTDFTGTKGLLEAWVGLNLYKDNAYLYFGEKRTNTNNRLALEDERFAQNISQTIAGQSNDGVAYGGLMQNFVGATREGGLFVETNFTIGTMRIYPSISVTTGDGQIAFGEKADAGLKYGGRIDIMPLGDFIKNNAFISHDLYYEPTLKVAFGVAGSYNVKASEARGSGNDLISGIFDKDGKASYADYRKIVTDFIVKYKGFSFIGEYTNASVNAKDLYSNSSATSLLTAETTAAKYNMGYGINLQSSYVTKSGWAFDTRFSFIEPEVASTTSLIQKENWYTVGVNKYLKNNALKIGINTSYIDRKVTPVSTSNWNTNLGVQLIF
ncbi:MAG: hypothetical protein ACRC6O_08520 [Flavobacterium sp.]